MEYADQYTKKEKIIRFTVFVILGLAVIAFNKLVFFLILTNKKFGLLSQLTKSFIHIFSSITMHRIKQR